MKSLHHTYFLRIHRRWSTTTCQERPNAYPYPKHVNPTPHQIFHLPRSASPHDVKARYYDLVRIYHPDTAISQFSVPSDMAHARFQSITAAYDILRGKKPATDASKNARWPTTASWRVSQNKRDLYTKGNDTWKDRIIIAGVVATLAAFVAQATYIRHQALNEILSGPQRSTTERCGQETDKLAAV